eukprot:c10121_g1_i2.p1 GENE.c10121_g1_i2~~c10121_g1_i2.p1  ORF type:complete len:172 (-),score=29.21 c10121_g1_i2:48-563(-)
MTPSMTPTITPTVSASKSISASISPSPSKSSLVCQYGGVFETKCLSSQDLRCGADFPNALGNPAQCDPNGPYPCCSINGWCGNTEAHCLNRGIDYRLFYVPSLCQRGGVFNTACLSSTRRCGAEFPNALGAPGQCDPRSSGPCCSVYGWCDNTPNHCGNGGIDYRQFYGVV